jgi:DNA repair exonuclease SbcCD ATPase subunit
MMAPKHYRDVYLREETYQKLLQLKAVMGKRSVNDVVEELLKCVTVNTVSSPVNTVSFTVSTVKPTVSTGDSPVSTVSPTVNTVKHGEDLDSNELVKRLESLEKSVAELREAVSALEKGLKDFTRKQQDLLNAYTSKTDQVLQRLSQVVELLQQVAESLRQGSEKVSEERQRVSEESVKKARREKVDACERLKRELAIFESDIADRIRDRDRFFAKIENVCGGIVVEGLKERVAIEKSFWQQFLEKLSKIDTSDDEKIKKSLDSLEYKLFKALKESALIIFDATAKKWIFVEKQKTGTSSGTDAGTALPSTSTTNSAVGGATATGSGTSSSTKASASQRKKHYKKRYGEEDESWLLQYVDNVA